MDGLDAHINTKSKIKKIEKESNNHVRLISLTVLPFIFVILFAFKLRVIHKLLLLCVFYFSLKAALS